MAIVMMKIIRADVTGMAGTAAARKRMCNTVHIVCVEIQIMSKKIKHQLVLSTVRRRASD